MKDNLTILGCISFPIKIEKEFYREYRLKRKEINKAEALLLAKNELEKRKTAELPDAEILSQTEENKLQDGFLIYRVSMECVENIAQNLDFEIDESGAVKLPEKQETPTP